MPATHDHAPVTERSFAALREIEQQEDRAQAEEIKQQRLEELRQRVFAIRPDAALSLRPWMLEEGWPLGGPVESE